MKKMRTLLRLRNICSFMVYALLFLVLKDVDVQTMILFLIVYIGTILVSYCKYGTFWVGYAYLYREGYRGLSEYLYASKTIMILDSHQYAMALTKGYEHDYLVLSMIENYLYRCIMEKDNALSVELLDNVMMKYHAENEQFFCNLSLITKYINVMHLIGWTGIKCSNQEVIELSIRMLTDLYIFMVNMGISYLTDTPLDKIKERIAYLKSNTREGLNPLEFVMIQNIFRTYKDIDFG